MVKHHPRSEPFQSKAMELGRGGFQTRPYLFGVDFEQMGEQLIWLPLPLYAGARHLLLGRALLFSTSRFAR